MSSLEDQSGKIIDAIAGIYPDGRIPNIVEFSAALGCAAAAMFHVVDNGGPVSQACVKLMKDTVDAVFLPDQVPGQTAVIHRHPRSVFPPCSSCGQDHHPSWDCVGNEASEG